jgi:hypothetical protein
MSRHGGQQVEGLNFWDTYAPVVSWHTICLTLVLSLLSNLRTRQLDYVGAFPHAYADCEKNNSQHHVLIILKNIYGL